MGPEHAIGAGVAELEGQAEGGEVEEVLGIAEHEADEPGAPVGRVDVTALGEEGREPPPRDVARGLRELEVEAGDEEVLLRRGRRLERHLANVFPYMETCKT